uniref:plasmid mobilization relaxosome protein MobC n=1 Tax=Mucilaginibacter sp. Bleaf8 TaxID=2834430 RepID=UPI001BCB28F4|nr:plasmid mobilization relaxosome protein MobC [Mucilaginibacter sp. Bleaf8]
MSQLETASAACGQTIGQLVRTKVFKGKFPQPVLPRIEQQAVIELNKIGVNLNQVTKALNSGIWPKDILSLLSKLLWVLERMLDELLTHDRKSKDR